MAETKKKNSAGKKKTSTAATSKEVETAAEEIVAEEVATVKAEKPTKRKPLPKLDLNELVEVESCFHGTLNFVSSKTGRRAAWSGFGATDYLTVEDLLSMRNTQPAFFKNNWIILTGDNADSVFEYLQLGRFYKDYRSLEDFAELFSMSPEELKDALERMNSEAKENVARHAYSLIQEGELDSVRLIEIIEDATGFNLRE